MNEMSMYINKGDCMALQTHDSTKRNNKYMTLPMENINM